MGVRRRYQTFIIVAFLVLTIGVYIGRRQAMSTFIGTAGAYPEGHVSVKGYRDGVLFYEYDDHNLIVTIGSKHVRNFLGFNNATAAAIVNIALSDDATPLTSWTKLPGEIMDSGLVRATGAASTFNATAFEVTYTWMASAPQSVQCTGMHWSATSGSNDNLFAAASISAVSLQANDMLQVTWTVNIPDG